MVSLEDIEFVQIGIRIQHPNWEVCNRMPFFVILKEVGSYMERVDF